MKSKTKLDYCVYIGRFQPFHLGHISTLQVALHKADHVIVVLGSHNSPRTIKNPFTAAEREEMIRACHSPEDNARLSFIYTEDRIYHDPTWVRTVEREVMKIAWRRFGSTGEDIGYESMPMPAIGIIGHKKDKATAGYVNQFKQWEQVDTPRIDAGRGQALHATEIRELYFSGRLNFLSSIVPPKVYEYLDKFNDTSTFDALKAEWDDGVAYENMYANAPFHSTNFYTADSVVIQSGHILLGTRKKAPGKGLWALPGGHVQQNETAAQASLRELDEETNIKVPEKVLKGSLFCEKLFDHPERSLRGRILKKNARTVDVAFGYKLDDAADLPHVVAGDDFEKVWWFTFDEVEKMRDQIFEDHADIIEYMLSRVEK